MSGHFHSYNKTKLDVKINNFYWTHERTEVTEQTTSNCRDKCKQRNSTAIPFSGEKLIHKPKHFDKCLRCYGRS